MISRKYCSHLNSSVPGVADYATLLTFAIRCILWIDKMTQYLLFRCDPIKIVLFLVEKMMSFL